MQRTPDLLSYLQTAVDAQPAAPKGRFILAGFSQFNLLQSITQSLAERAWLEVLETAHVIFTVTPYHRNFGKRLVKTPKLYFVDTGMVAWLLGIASVDAMKIHAMRGALFENFVVLEILKHRYNHGNLRPVYFWRNSNGREVDLLLDDNEKLLAIEIKSGAIQAVLGR